MVCLCQTAVDEQRDGGVEERLTFVEHECDPLGRFLGREEESGMYLEPASAPPPNYVLHACACVCQLTPLHASRT